ncbi:MAG: hypothetical protein CMJ78_24875 [Planctomycetaceae bacterium]|nr:hypothetical protein [Planctomycetaceae bacterium]
MAATCRIEKSSLFMSTVEFPTFQPHSLIRGGHAQTLAGAFLPWRSKRPTDFETKQHRIELPDGDTIILHDDCPAEWQSGQRCVLMVHGLAGSHESGYMVRISSKLTHEDIRAFRLDLRGCGAGEQLARRPYNAGSNDDVLQAIHRIIELASESPISVVGFSLSGNIVLKMIGQDPENVPSQLDSCMAVNPPIDLARSVETLKSGFNRFYDKHFVKLLCQAVTQRQQHFDDFELPAGYNNPQTLYEFDDVYTSKMAGYENALDYYSNCRADQFLSKIEIPTLILSAADDPMVPPEIFDGLDLPKHVTVHIESSGGHLGYIGRKNIDPDRRWLDWRVVDWVKTRSKGDSR